MKRIILVLLLITAFTTADAQKFKFGLTAAPGLAWLKPDTEGFESDGSKISFSYGIIGDYNFTDNYTLGTGVEIAYKGGKIINRDTAISTSGAITKYNLQYIELPITIKMKTNEIGYITYFGRFGFVPALNIKANGELDIAGTVTEVDLDDDIEKFNLSLLIGAGAQYSLSGETAIIASINFNNGFLDVIKSSNGKAVANVISLNIGVLF